MCCLQSIYNAQYTFFICSCKCHDIVPFLDVDPTLTTKIFHYTGPTEFLVSTPGTKKLWQPFMTKITKYLMELKNNMGTNFYSKKRLIFLYD